MNQELQTQTNDLFPHIDKVEFLSCVARGEVTTIEELSTRFSIPIETAVALMSDPRTITGIKRITEAKTNLSFHTKAVDKLLSLIQNDDPKIALSAIKLLGQISNNLRIDKKSDVNVNVSLEGLIPKEEIPVTVSSLPILDSDSEEL